MELRFPVIDWSSTGIDIRKIKLAVDMVVMKYEANEQSIHPLYICTAITGEVGRQFEKVIDEAMFEGMCRWFGFDTPALKALFKFVQEYRGITLGFALYDSIQKYAGAERYLTNLYTNNQSVFDECSTSEYIEQIIRNTLNIKSFYPYLDDPHMVGLLSTHTMFNDFRVFRYEWIKDIQERLRNE